MTTQRDGAKESDPARSILVTNPPHRGEPDAEGRYRRPVTDPIVFGVTAAIVVLILVWGLTWPDNFESTMASILNWVVTNLGWLFIISSTCFVLFALWIAFSRHGRIPLGRDDEKPEFNTVSWVRDDVQRRHGHRADLLGRHRTAHALHQPATRACRFSFG